MQSYKDLTTNYKSGNVSATSSNLNNIMGGPEHITGSLYCYSNNLTSLAGGPKIVDVHYCCYNNLLTDLVGCASHIGYGLYCGDNNITSLVGIHKIIKSCQSITFDAKKIKEGGIGLLLIANLKDLNTNNIAPLNIIRRYLGTGTKGMMECSKELISKGYAQYAKL